MNQTKQHLMQLLATVSAFVGRSPKPSAVPPRRRGMRTTEELLAEIDRKKELKRQQLLDAEIRRVGK